MKWTTIQLGSREHYAIPLSLHRDGCLQALITDAWLSPSAANLLRPYLPSLAGRGHPGIPTSRVIDNTVGRLLTDRKLKLLKLPEWQTILERNRWFGRWAAQTLHQIETEVVFSYAYVAKYPFLEAKKKNAICIYGQIDGGPYEDVLVKELTHGYQHLGLPSIHAPAPASYWRQWREEIALADKIVVNSQWSKALLLKASVPEEKIVEIPLVYSANPSSNLSSLQVSVETTGIRAKRERLQVLFLGSLILRKGIGQLLAAIKVLQAEPIDFTFAGPIGISIPDDILAMANVTFLGPVDGLTATSLYQRADVFLFPTLSDGFGLTQLEALAHGLPVIVSQHCGRVVDDHVNGLLLEEVTPQSICSAILSLLHNPELLEHLRSNASVPDRFDPKHLITSLRALE
jgi:glycosyltransferase involved in cell wall biosynthesis